MEISRLGPDLGAEQRNDVLALAVAATEADGVAPLSEQALLSLRHPAEADVVHLLMSVDGAIAGYAQLAGVPDSPTSDVAENASGEVVIHPAFRNHGLGKQLVRAAIDVAESAGVKLAIWAHGEHPAALALAASLRLSRSRVLFKMSRPTAEPLPPIVVPDGVRIREFVVGQDEQAWLRVNARAFATHAEQGKWALSDVQMREAEPWFDAAGFLLAVRAESPETLLGFHWTKRHSPEIGEVYVVGVDPDAQGLRLGVALTLAGLEYLAKVGCSEVILYVDESNPRAVRLYTGLGFEVSATDVMYADW